MIWLVLLPVFLLEKGAFIDFLEERRLHTPGEFLSTVGEITETRSGQDGNVEVRYKFEVDGVTYTASDEVTKRRNLWIPMVVCQEVCKLSGVAGSLAGIEMLRNFTLRMTA